MTMTPLAKYLATEMCRLGLNAHSLAIKAGLRRDVIRDVLRAKTGQPGSARLVAIAKVLGRKVEDLVSEAPLPALQALVKAPAQLVEYKHAVRVTDEELALLAFWRTLYNDDRRKVTDIVKQNALKPPPG